MARIEPFKCLRPDPDVVDRVAALPYDVYNSEEAKEEVKREPISFLSIDRAETNFKEDISPYSECVYQKAKERLQAMEQDGTLLKEDTEEYYIYQLIMDGRKQTGVVACASIDDYLEGTIKKHENTRSEKENDRIHHVEICKAQTGPIFLAYRSDQGINGIVDQELEQNPIYDFMAQDGVQHKVIRVSESGSRRLHDEFLKIHDIYIADGHHRAAAAVKVGQTRRRMEPNFIGTEAFNYFLCVLFPEDQLKILPYNRCIADLNGYTPDEFLTQVSKKFIIKEKGIIPYQPQEKGEFGMYLSGTWYSLSVREEVKISQDPVAKLDVSILHKYLIEPILGILDPKTDKRIDFIGGIRGLAELEKRVGQDMGVAFSMYPTSIQEVFAVSDAGLLMPPKSTWFEPKLLSGLFVHEI